MSERPRGKQAGFEGVKPAEPKDVDVIADAWRHAACDLVTQYSEEHDQWVVLRSSSLRVIAAFEEECDADFYVAASYIVPMLVTALHEAMGPV